MGGDSSGCNVREFQEGGENWTCASLSQERYGYGPSNLRKWFRNRGVRIGNGKHRLRRVIRYFPRLSRGGRAPTEFFAESDIQAIASALTEEARRCERSDAGRVPIKEAAARCGIHPSTFYDMEERGAIKLRREKSVETGGTRTLLRVFVNERDVQEIMESRKPKLRKFDESGDTWLCSEAVHEEFTHPGRTLTVWRKRNCLELGRKINAKRRPNGFLSPGKGQRIWLWYYSKKDLERISEKRTGLDTMRAAGLVPIKEAAAQCGIGVSLFWSIARRGAKTRKLQPVEIIKKRLSEAGSGNPWRLFIRASDVDAIRAALNGASSNGPPSPSPQLATPARIQPTKATEEKAVIATAADGIHGQRFFFEQQFIRENPGYSPHSDSGTMRRAYATEFPDDGTAGRKDFENSRRWARKHSLTSG